MKDLKGSCNCGEITFTVRNGDKSTTACHCGQCRKQSGNFWASGYASDTDVSIHGALRWYEASEKAKRGFCPTCGSFLFWKAHDEDGMSYALGAIDGPTGLSLQKHIFTASKGDYYTLADDVPKM